MPKYQLSSTDDLVKTIYIELSESFMKKYKENNDALNKILCYLTSECSYFKTVLISSFSIACSSIMTFYILKIINNNKDQFISKRKFDQNQASFFVSPQIKDEIISVIDKEIENANKKGPSSENKIISFMLHGPNGTGKTEVAKYIATKYNAEFMNCSPNALYKESYHNAVGIALSSRFDDIKKKAKEGKRVVVLVDEADVFIGKDVKDSHNTVISIGYNSDKQLWKTFLTEMIHGNVQPIIFFTTNKDIQECDENFIRCGRITGVVKLSYFDKDDLKEYFDQNKITEKINLEVSNYSGENYNINTVSSIPNNLVNCDLWHMLCDSNNEFDNFLKENRNLTEGDKKVLRQRKEVYNQYKDIITNVSNQINEYNKDKRSLYTMKKNIEMEKKRREIELMQKPKKNNNIICEDEESKYDLRGSRFDQDIALFEEKMSILKPINKLNISKQEKIGHEQNLQDMIINYNNECEQFNTKYNDFDEGRALYYHSDLLQNMNFGIVKSLPKRTSVAIQLRNGIHSSEQDQIINMQLYRSISYMVLKKDTFESEFIFFSRFYFDSKYSYLCNGSITENCIPYDVDLMAFAIFCRKYNIGVSDVSLLQTHIININPLINNILSRIINSSEEKDEIINELQENNNKYIKNKEKREQYKKKIEVYFQNNHQRLKSILKSTGMLRKNDFYDYEPMPLDNL